MKEKACKNCKRLYSGKKCPVCNSTDFANTYRGAVLIVDSKNSEIAKALNVNSPGKYALRVK